MKNWSKVFAFTFRQQVRSKSYIITTAIMLFIIVAVILLIFTISAANSDDTAEETGYISEISQVFVVDNAGIGEFDWNSLNGFEENYTDIEYSAETDFDNAVKNAEQNTKSLVLEINRDYKAYSLNVVRPDNTEIEWNDSEEYSYFVSRYINMILINTAGLTPEQLAVLYEDDVSIEISDRIEDGEEEESDGLDGIREALGFAVPYVIIMLLYFLILFYGQGVASSVLLEKTSKLMDTFLVSIKPSAMVFGKLIAVASAGLMQLAIWIAAGLLSVLLGCGISKMIAPDHEIMIIDFFKQIGSLKLFSTSSIIISILLVIAGFLLYCSLSAIGGSLAGKTEDLGTTNSLFSMALVISFMFSLFGGLNSGKVNLLLCYIPFTSVLTVPGWLMLNKISTLTAIIALAITMLSTICIAYLAGKIYKMMSFYKGNPPSIKKVIGMLKTK